MGLLIYSMIYTVLQFSCGIFMTDRLAAESLAVRKRFNVLEGLPMKSKGQQKLEQ